MATRAITTEIPNTYIKHIPSLVSHLTGDHINRIYLLWLNGRLQPLIPVTFENALQLCAFLLANPVERRIFARLMLVDAFIRPVTCPIEDVMKMTTE